MKTSSRRMFLRGAGLFALSIPFLPSLVRDARAASAPIKRFIALAMPYGSVREYWFPPDDVRKLSPLGPRGKGMPLGEIAGDLSPVFRRTTFEPILQKMLLLDGIDGKHNIGHQKSYPLTGFVAEPPALPPGKSIDQIIAEQASIYDQAPAFTSLNFASGPDGQTHSGNTISFTTSGGSVTPVPQMASPSASWEYLFKNVASGPDAEQVFERIKARKLSVLDHVLVDYQRLHQHPKLSRADQLRLEAHAQYVRELELGTQAAKPIDCDAPSSPVGEDLDKTLPRLQAQVQNVVHAVRCGLTRVLTFNMEPTSSSYPGASSHHHSLSHKRDNDPQALASMEVIDRLHLEQIASLVSQLDVEEDPVSGRTFLDNSIVFVGNDMGSVVNHTGTRMPCLLFGGKDVLKQGLLVDFRHELKFTDPQGAIEGAGVSYNSLLVTLCQAMGLGPEQYEQGQAGIGDYAASKWRVKAFPSQEEYESFAFGDRRTPLAELLAKA